MMGINSLLVDPQTSILSQQLLVGIEGSSVDISCTSTGVPVPSIIWTVNNQQGTLREDIFQINQGVAFSSLVIVNVQYSADNNAIYTCTGSNTHGKDSVSRTLQVLGMEPKLNYTLCTCTSTSAISL